MLKRRVKWACIDAVSDVLSAQEKAQRAQAVLGRALSALAEALGSSTSPGSANSASAPGNPSAPSSASASPGAGAGTSVATSPTPAVGSAAASTGAMPDAAADRGGTRTVTAADLAKDQAAIDQARVDLVKAEAALDSAVLRAPYAGTIGSVSSEPGESIAAGSSVAVLLGSDRPRRR